MKYFLPLLSILFFSSAAFAADNGTGDYTIPKYKIGKIRKITVTVEAKKNDFLTSDKEGCQLWKMTQERGLFFFSHAKKISSASAIHDHELSSCTAEGTVELANGDNGEWTISPGGIGTLIVNIGKPNEAYLNLYCEKCDD